ncbi:MAG: efflux RND transporter periplasmic adaptor subunit [Ferruginibacter sp.]
MNQEITINKRIKFSNHSTWLVAFGFTLILFAACKSKNNTTNLQNHQPITITEFYTCSMHPEIIRDKPGNCPICDMLLVKKVTDAKALEDIELATVLKPTNEFVVSSVPVTTLQKKEEQLEIDALGNIAYDTRASASISSRVAGRIEKLYIHYRYQAVHKGQRIMDIYSPELMTAQQNFLFVLKNDPGNSTLIQAAKDKLLLLGMSSQQLQQVTSSGKHAFTIAIYSNYNGHVHEARSTATMNNTTEATGMKDIALITEELTLKEGMYVQKGQAVFEVNDPGRAWAVLNIYGDNQQLIKTGNIVRVVPESAPGKAFRAIINFIEPFYRKDSKTLTARVYFNNMELKIPVGSQVKATIFGNAKNASWLPKEAVVSLGLGKVVFIKTGDGFKAKSIATGILHQNNIQVISGLSIEDSVAVNAQYLMDSESFIKIKN